MAKFTEKFLETVDGIKPTIDFTRESPLSFPHIRVESLLESAAGWVSAWAGGYPHGNVFTCSTESSSNIPYDIRFTLMIPVDEVSLEYVGRAHQPGQQPFKVVTVAFLDASENVLDSQTAMSVEETDASWPGGVLSSGGHGKKIKYVRASTVHPPGVIEYPITSYVGGEFTMTVS